MNNKIIIGNLCIDLFYILLSGLNLNICYASLCERMGNFFVFIKSTSIIGLFLWLLMFYAIISCILFAIIHIYKLLRQKKAITEKRIRNLSFITQIILWLLSFIIIMIIGFPDIGIR